MSMSIEKTGALVSRGIGVGLIIIGVSSALYFVPSFYVPSGMVTSGWTSYSPLAPNTGPLAGLRNTIYSVNSITWFYLPSIVQTLVGIFMLVCSRSVGRWLAKGLSDRDGG